MLGPLCQATSLPLFGVTNPKHPTALFIFTSLLPQLLKDFSPYAQSFHPTGLSKDRVIPGQPSGKHASCKLKQVREQKQEIHGVTQVCLDTGDQGNRQHKQVVKKFCLRCSELFVGTHYVILQSREG